MVVRGSGGGSDVESVRRGWWREVMEGDGWVGGWESDG